MPPPATSHWPSTSGFPKQVTGIDAELLQIGGGDPLAHVGVFDVVGSPDPEADGGVVEGSHVPLVEADLLPFAVDGPPESFRLPYPPTQSMSMPVVGYQHEPDPRNAQMGATAPNRLPDCVL